MPPPHSREGDPVQSKGEPCSTKEADPTGGGRPKTGRDARLAVNINADIHQTIKANAAIQKISLAEYMERILLAYLSEDPDVAPPKTEE